VELRKGNKEKEEVEKVWNSGKGTRRRKRWRKCETKEREKAEGRDRESVGQRKGIRRRKRWRKCETKEREK
jgi:hypothetical protein